MSSRNSTATRVGLAHLLFGRQVDRDALALVAVLRLDDDRQADFPGGGPGVVLVLDRAAVAAPATPAACSSFLVSSLSCAIDSAMALVMLVSAAWMRCCLLPQPNWTRLPCGQAAVGNAARQGGRDDGAGGWARGGYPRRVRAVRFSAPSRSKGVSFERRLAELLRHVRRRGGRRLPRCIRRRPDRRRYRRSAPCG